MPSFAQKSNGSTSTRRVLFAVLVVVSIVLLILYGRDGEDGPLHAVQASVMGVTSQVSSVGAGVGAAADSASTAIDDVTANPTTLEGLRQQNEELRQMLADMDEYRQEVDRLRGLLDMKQVSAVTGPIAHVIGRSTNAWDQSVTIDLGSEDGVVSGMTVMSSTGVIGQVSRASEHTSTVRLLTDPNSGAAVMVQSSRANGIVRGSLNGLLYLEDIDEDKLPVEGDVILTSGLGGSYERGLIVGAVASVGDSASSTSGRIIINPNASAEMLEEGIVVFKAPNVNVTAKDSSSAKKAGNASADEQNVEGQEEGEAVDVTAVQQEDPIDAVLLEESLQDDQDSEDMQAEDDEQYNDEG